jgi:hypothetical protein
VGALDHSFYSDCGGSHNSEPHEEKYPPVRADSAFGLAEKGMAGKRLAKIASDAGQCLQKKK